MSGEGEGEEEAVEEEAFLYLKPEDLDGIITIYALYTHMGKTVNSDRNGEKEDQRNKLEGGQATNEGEV
jgi:hypothetical protein